MRKIYLASSWRNERQPEILTMLRDLGHEVYDFRNPEPGQNGFAWKDTGVNMYDMNTYVKNIHYNSVALYGYGFDKRALDWCDTCILLLPCGRSAHLEAGYAIGQRKQTLILLSEYEFVPELMYLLATAICASPEDLMNMLKVIDA